MLIRITLIVAVVTGLAAVGLNVVKVREKITTLQTNLANETAAKNEALNNLANTRSELDKTTQDLKKTRGELASAQEARDKALTEAAEQRRQAVSLRDQLAKATQQRDEVQAELSQWKVFGYSVEQIRLIITQLKTLQKERQDLTNKLALLQSEYRRATNELARYVSPDDFKPALPPDLKGKVVVVDPKWEFVVVDVGENKDVVEYGQLLVSRQGKLVAKLRVSSVQPDRCIANVMPGWKLADIYEGDLVTAAP